MAIRFACPGCGKRLKVAPSEAGRQLVRPKCGTPVTAPTETASEPGAASASPPPASSEASPPSAPANPFASPKEIHLAAASGGFATEDELPPDPELRVRVFPAAAGLMFVGICGLLLRLANTLRHMLGIELPESATNAERLLWPGGASATLFLIIMSVLLILSGHRMRNLQSYWFVVGMSLLAMVPCVSPCCSLGVPVGIYSLIVLWNQDTKRAFRE